MSKGRTASHSLGFKFLGAGVLLVVSIALTYYMGMIALESNRKLATMRATIEHLEKTISTLKDAETGQRGFLLTGDESYLAPYEEARGKMGPAVDQLRRLAAQGELDKSSVARVAADVEGKLLEIAETIRLRREGSPEAALSLVKAGRGQKLMADLRAEISKMEDLERQQFAKAYQDTDRATHFRTATFIVTAIANLAFLGWVYRRILNEMAWRERVEAELKQSHAELESKVVERTAELTAANRELEAFGYSVSHDLRAPLRHISSYIKFLEQRCGPKMDAEERRFTKVIADAARRMGALIDDLLVLSRIGRATLKEEPVALDRLLEEVRQELEPAMKERAIDWRVGALPTVQGDRTLLRSALVNLISNAVKYSRERQPAKIEVGSRTDNGEVVVFVKDNGAGFDMRYADKLFGVFQRLHDPSTYEGTGIGLASVRRVIQRHGGRTWAEGEEGKGATFYFSLPKEKLL